MIFYLLANCFSALSNAVNKFFVKNGFFSEGVRMVDVTFHANLINFFLFMCFFFIYRRKHDVGFSLRKSFLLGSLSAIVEPIFAVLGAMLVTSVQVLLPFIMSFTAGAMIFVVLMELLPELLQQKKRNLFSIMVMIGFAIMMVLEIILG